MKLYGSFAWLGRYFYSHKYMRWFEHSGSSHMIVHGIIVSIYLPVCEGAD
jgi:hypothetical protein